MPDCHGLRMIGSSRVGRSFVPILPCPERLHAAFVRSPHAHARILSGRKPAGFEKSVYFADDLVGLWRLRSTAKMPGFKPSDWPILAKGKVQARRRAGRHGDRPNAGRSRRHRGARRDGIRASAANRLDDGRLCKKASRMSTRNGATMSSSTSSLRPAIYPRRRPLPFTSSSAAFA